MMTNTTTVESNEEVIDRVRSINSLGYISLYATMLGVVPFTILVILPSVMAEKILAPWYFWPFAVLAVFGVIGMVSNGIALSQVKKANRPAFDAAFSRAK